MRCINTDNITDNNNNKKSKVIFHLTNTLNNFQISNGTSNTFIPEINDNFLFNVLPLK